MKRIVLAIIALLIVACSVFFLFSKYKSFISQKVLSVVMAEKIYNGVGYVAVDPKHFDVSLFADNISAPTRIKITPDGKHLLVAEIGGQVIAFNRNGDAWEKNSYPLVKVDTHFPGFPPEEAGLTGLVFSADFANNGKLFLLYSFKDKDGKVLNRISVTTLTSKENSLSATPPQQIFEANVAGSDSHQITDGIGVMVKGQPQLLFAVGEGFNILNTSQDAKKESGKVLMISEDGSNPVGERPYQDDPKVQAVGLRNAYVMAQNTYLNSGKGLQHVLIADTGPNRFDRIMNFNLYDSSGNKTQPINLGWNGSEDDLQKPIADPNHPGVKDLVTLRLQDTLTFTGLAFHPGKGAIPQSTKQAQSVLMTLYGKTGSKSNAPGKEIWLGRLTGPLNAPRLTNTPIVIRNPLAEGKLGNPVGLEVDPQTGDFFFADVIEGRIYRVSVNQI